PSSLNNINGCPTSKGTLQEGQIMGCSDEQQMDGIQASARFGIAAAIHCQLKLRERAGVGIGKLERPADPARSDDSNSRTSLFCGFFGNLFWQSV
ncbi:MAG: hypothetical protein V4733_10080, partial [Verrucomicrobiota bacterium]